LPASAWLNEREDESDSKSTGTPAAAQLA